METAVKQQVEIMVKRLILTNPDEESEENILTAGEEATAIDYAISRAKEHYRDQHLLLGDRLAEILDKSANIDWLTRIDVEGILKTANSSKHYEIWLKDKREQEKKAEILKKEEIIKRHTATFFYNIMAWNSLNVYGKRLIVSGDTKHLITTICFFLSNDERFESELGYSFRKGLLIRGISGLGKTFLLECVKDNELLPISIYSMVKIAEAIKMEGAFAIPNKPGIIYLDDVGTEEPTINHYGTKVNFFKDFIEKFYLNNIKFNRLIISTNNNFSELEEKYGFRVRSRIKDMFNIVDVTGVDMRGK